MFERFMEFQAVIGRLWLAKAWEFVIRRPVEVTGIYNGTAHHGSISGQVFGGRMHNQRRAMLDRAAQKRGCSSVVDDQRNAGVVGDFRQSIKVADIAAWICDCFTKQRTRVFVDSALNSTKVIGVDKFGVPTKTLDRIGPLRDRSAIESIGRNDVTTRAHKWEKGHDLSRMAG